MDIEYMDIVIGEILSSIRLLLWSSFIVQFVPPIEWKKIDVGYRYISQLEVAYYQCIENLSHYPFYSISIIVKF